jgi:DNA-binding NarL/FixJ family response regulator
MQPALRDRCLRAVAADPSLRTVEAGSAQVGVFDISDESLDERLAAALRSCPKMLGLLLSPGCTRGDCAGALARGFHGLLSYRRIESGLAEAARAMASGYLWFPVTAIPALLLLEPAGLAAQGRIPLTPQEWKVAALASRGLSNKEIGDALRIAESTVKFHLANLFGKCCVRSRREVAAALWGVTA